MDKSTWNFLSHGTPWERQGNDLFAMLTLADTREEDIAKERKRDREGEKKVVSSMVFILNRFRKESLPWSIFPP